MDSTVIKPTIDYISYIVKPETMKFWTWYHTEVEKGRLISVITYSPSPDYHIVHQWIDFGIFGISLLTALTRTQASEHSSPFNGFIHKHGDHFVYDIGIGVYNFNNMVKKLAGLSRNDMFNFNRHSSETKAWLRRPDHVTYVVTPDTIQFWKNYFLALGGEEAKQIDDVMIKLPGKTSSMMLWTIKFDNFGVALVAGLDRIEASQVTKFSNKHGITPPQVQHVAYDTWDLSEFLAHLRKFGGRTRGEVFRRNDGFGELLQIFGAGYTEGDPAETAFPEYVQRPDKEKGEELPSNVTFSQEAGIKLYDDVQDASDEGRVEPLIDCSMMPADWKAKIWISEPDFGESCCRR